MLLALIVLAAFDAAQLVNAADKLPLKQGLYVREGVPCDTAPNADIINYWGEGLGSAHELGTIIKMRKKGNIYYISEKIQGLGGVGGEGTYIEKSTIIIKSRTSFVYGDGGDTYRWCSDPRH